MSSKLIIAIGSNINQEANVNKAKALLGNAFSNKMIFSDTLWTDPIGIDGDKFMNCIGIGYTDMKVFALIDVLKRIEKQCGDTKELRQKGLITIDIDLLMFGEIKYHTADWQRGYIKSLMEDMDNE